MFFRRRNFVRRHFSLQRAGIIFAPVFGRNVRYDWFSASMRRQMILDPLSPALRDRRGGPELDYVKITYPPTTQ